MSNTPVWLSPSAALNRFGDPQAQLTELTALSEQAQRYGFQLGKLGLLLQAGVASEVVEQPSIYPIPNAPDACRGLINLRGTLVPVYEIGQALGHIPTVRSEQNKSALLILGRGDDMVGLLIDSLPVPIPVALHQPLAPPEHLPSVLHAHAGPCYRIDDRLWIEFDYQGFITGVLASSPGEPSAAIN